MILVNEYSSETSNEAETNDITKCPESKVQTRTKLPHNHNFDYAYLNRKQVEV